MKRSVFTLLALGTVAGCHCQPTGLFVSVSWDGGQQPDQLHFHGTNVTTDSGLFDAIEPTVANGPLVNPSTVLVQLDDSLNGKVVDVHVDALQGMVPAGSGDGQATVQSGSTVNVTVALVISIPSPDAGCSTATCDGCCDGVTCRATDAGTFCRDVAGACHAVDAGQVCSDETTGACNFCVPGSANSCATGGACLCGGNPLCAANSDTCDAGQCGCGPGPACPTTESCVGGQCQCGSGGGCDAGQACQNGKCICDSTTCADGCCQGDVCVTVQSAAACGLGGLPCQGCDGGTCLDGGFCSGCNPNTCKTGCCLNDACQDAGIVTCGTNASACIDCGIAADSCAGGTCECGAGAACGPGLACVGGQCTCDSASCRDGCCFDGGCFNGVFADCGIDGGACTDCNGIVANTCGADGKCQCGPNAQCAAGQQCMPDNTCQCNAFSCSSGCCSQGQCHASGSSTCGTGGTACVDCSAYSSTCSNGVCTCAGSTCIPPKSCNCLILCGCG